MLLLLVVFGALGSNDCSGDWRVCFKFVLNHFGQVMLPLPYYFIRFVYFSFGLKGIKRINANFFHKTCRVTSKRTLNFILVFFVL